MRSENRSSLSPKGSDLTAALDRPRLLFGFLPRRNSEPDVRKSSTTTGTQKKLAKSDTLIIDSIVPQKESSRKTPTLTSTAIAEVVVIASCKAQGFLRVSEKDVVTLMEARDREGGIVYVRSADGASIGRLPRTAVRIDVHTSNLYLAAVRAAIASPTVLWEAMQQRIVSPKEVHDMLVVTDLLLDGLVNLLCQEKMQHSVDNEFLRDSSPATDLVRFIFQSNLGGGEWATEVGAPPKQNHDNWDSAESLLHAIESVIISLLQCSSSIPSEVAVVLRALLEAASVRIACSCFCLRYVCPALVHHSKWIARALQLIANGVDPPEESFLFQLQGGLQNLQRSMEQVVITAAASPSVFDHQDIRYPLVDPAARLHAFVFRDVTTQVNAASVLVAEANLKEYLAK